MLIHRIFYPTFSYIVAVNPTSTDKPVSTDTAMPSFEEMMDRVAHVSHSH